MPIHEYYKQLHDSVNVVDQIWDPNIQTYSDFLA